MDRVVASVPLCRVWRALAWLVLTSLLTACAALPPRPPLPEQPALPPAHEGVLAQQLEPMLQANPGLSGFVPLETGVDAFAARVWLVDRASRSLDLQSYIWRSDRTGRWLLTRLLTAAERGVRVRLLLDDNGGSKALDALLAVLDAHANAEVRLFNPYRHRGIGRAWDLATDFSRLNRRMHNKSFSADGVATIIGGRNVGDEYFGAAFDMEFADLDVLAVGPIVGDVSASFDRYWNSASAYPGRPLIGTGRPEATDARGMAEAADYVRDLREQPQVERWRERGPQPQVERWRERGPQPQEFAWGRATLFVDPPDKALDQAAPRELMLPRLARTLGRAERNIELVSPYFVPSEEGIAGLAALHAQGVRLRVLTNSLATTDVAAVHAGYGPRRPALLDAGVELYELRPEPSTEPPSRRRLLGIGSSRASLHAKTFTVDNERVFIGSFNFDPRSAWLNTEIGVLLEHPGLARRIGGAFDSEIPRESWRVTRDPEAPGGQGLRWSGVTPEGEPIEHRQEPGAGWLTRLWVWFLSLFPIEPLL